MKGKDIVPELYDVPVLEESLLFPEILIKLVLEPRFQSTIVGLSSIQINYLRIISILLLLNFKGKKL